MLCHEGNYALVHENAHRVQVILLSLAYNSHAYQNARKSNLLTCTYIKKYMSCQAHTYAAYVFCQV